ncbi:MAG: hypothetical protein FJ302_09830 [Planctomycetes bacterium]|nr:hypothetical protein [Planctomycetota bacterium]
MNLSRVLWTSGLTLAVILSAQSSFAQAVPSKEPSSTHIFPAGGRRGTAVPVRIGTEAMPPGANLRLWGDGVRAAESLGERVKPRYEPSARRPPRDADAVGANMSYPTEWASEFNIAADAPLGTAAWRVTCGWGGTRVRPFLIGDLPEFLETESNSTAERAERVNLPVTINGQIAGERDIDCFVFSATSGQLVIADLFAARIGSPLDPVVELFAADGRKVRAEVSRVADDNRLSFRIPGAGDYVLQIANVSFRGGPEFVYRVTLSDAEQAEKNQLADRTTTSGHALSSDAGIRTTERLTPTEVLRLPAAIQGHFLKADSEDSFRILAKKDEFIAIECRPASLSSIAMPISVLEDATGRALAKASGAESVDRACLIEWKAPADGEYRLRVRDLQHGTRGGPEFAYRLSVRQAQPDFQLSLSPDYVNVTQGNRTDLDVTAKRFGGFTGPIDLSITGLPEGVTFEPPRIADNQTSLKLVLKAIDDTRPTDATLRLIGNAMIANQPVEHAASVASLAEAATANSVQLTVQHKPIFKLTCNEAYQYGHRGTIYPYAMQIERLGGFDGEIHVQLCERQVQDLDGIEVVETLIPPGVTEFKNLVYLPETMHASVQHHCRPYSQVWATFTDKWGQRQSMLSICDKRNMIRTMPTVVKLKSLDEHVTARPGTTVRCQLVLDRTPNFDGAMVIELIEPPARTGFMAERVRIEAGQTRTEMVIRIDDSANCLPDLSLRFRAVGQLREDVTVISEAAIPVRLEP